MKSIEQRILLTKKLSKVFLGAFFTLTAINICLSTIALLFLSINEQVPAIITELLGAPYLWFGWIGSLTAIFVIAVFLKEYPLKKNGQQKSARYSF